jgi:phosphoribosylaminoimidazolecarboxamide formyltransferase/IMP cyclohydrolase
MNGEELPERLDLKLERLEKLRYGENPHQSAGLYKNSLEPDRPGVASAKQVQGKELSYNNLADADAAFECVAEFEDPAVVIVKHMNPCGVALGKDAHETYLKAFACDPVSAFGGIVALNRTLDKAVAEEMVKIFLEVVIAPEADAEALAVLSMKPNVRVLLTGGMPEPRARRTTFRSIAGGVLVQTSDDTVFDADLKTVTKRAPTPQELDDMRFAFIVCKHVKSNAIVYAKDGTTLGIGAGQMSRIYSAKIAALKAGEAKHKAGATAITQPGGSLKDQDSIDKANEYGMAMAMTGMRHFRH